MGSPMSRAACSKGKVTLLEQCTTPVTATLVEALLIAIFLTIIIQAAVVAIEYFIIKSKQR
jgi:hypothetical protein